MLGSAWSGSAGLGLPRMDSAELNPAGISCSAEMGTAAVATKSAGLG